MKRSYRILGQAFRAIGRNKGRSFLTMLGIIIGIASVIALVAVGNGASNAVAGKISSLGTDIITIRSGAAPTSTSAAGSEGLGGAIHDKGPQVVRMDSSRPKGTESTLTDADLQAIKDNASSWGLSSVAAHSNNMSNIALTDKDGKNITVHMAVSGTEPSYFNMYDLSANKGKLFSGDDVTNKNKVAVLGKDAATDLFDTQDPIGKTIKLEDEDYTVIGVLNSKDQTNVANANRQIYIPVSSALLTYDQTKYATIYVQAADEDQVSNAKAAINKKLLELHGQDSRTANFTIHTPQDLLNTAKQSTSIFTTLLAGIAGISLVVGGIGIMNIMLVAVGERTREIGLRKALGARTGDILLQFMFEAVLLCLTGGLIGIALGALTAANLSQILTGIVPVVSIESVILAVAVSTAVGLVFGIYPAAKAARLNPIDALRYE